MAEGHAPLWTHDNPVRITAGHGSLAKLIELLPAGERTLLVTTRGSTRRGTTERVLKMLGRDRVVVYDLVTPNPELDALRSAIEHIRPTGIERVVALGGGSVIDTAKAFAATFRSVSPDPLRTLLFGEAREVRQEVLPLVAIPTTSGTGAEVTPFATVWDPATGRKLSLADRSLYPVHAILDPGLTLSLPPDDTLYPALDAISHALESLWNKNRTPISAALAFRALALSVEALPVVLEKPDDLDGRAELQYASTLAGVAISQTRTALAHSISYPLTSRFSIPHGLACSFTLPEILDANIDRLTTDPGERARLAAMLRLLRALKLGGRVTRYASIDEILRVQDEMVTKGRMENFAGSSDSLPALLHRSIG